MTTLGDIAKIEYNLSNSQLKAVKALHLVAYGQEAQPRMTRKRLREFSGFGLEKGSEDYENKLTDVKERTDSADLVSICHILDLDYKGSSDDVVDRICSFMNDLSVTENNSGKEEEEDDVDDEEDVADDEDVDDDDDDDEEVSLAHLQARMRVRKTESFALTFRDIEDSIRSFDGKAEYPVQKWIADFEEIADITGWNDLQKLIFAKKSLKGLAKLFVQSEKGIKSWSILKRKLKEEFEVKVSSAQIHKILMSRKKGYSESVQEYVLVMREIGNRANIETEVVIQYIIDGIQDDSSNKTILYGARNFSEFKEKVKLYEKIKSSKQSFDQGKKNEHKYNNDNSRNDRRNTGYHEKNFRSKVQVCYNCGEKNHKSNECPNKNKGVKCFGCNEYGHMANKCPRKNASNRNVSAIEVVPKNGVTLKIHEVQLTALLDTGSDISALRMDVIENHFSNIQLEKDLISIRGIGLDKTETLGSFKKTVLVNDVEVLLKFHVIPSNASGFKAIIGNDILSQVDVSIRDDGIVLYKKEKENFLMHITIDEEKDVEAIDVTHIKNPKHQEKVKNLIEMYQPEKCLTTDIKMNIVLKTEEAIYQSPRRLAMPEKIIVEKQIKEWLEEEIIRPSSSDFASPIVLVSKKDGQTRICCDYRKLNKNVIKDRFPLPLIEDVLDCLQDAKYFSTIDLRNGFFHVPVAEESIKYTSFVTHNGQYEFLKCPFGLCNSPAVFQRYISYIFRDLTRQGIAMYYMDDLIILSKDEKEGIERLEKVLQVARDYGLEIKKKKCQILKTRVEFLGFIIENGTVQPSEAKTTAISRFPKPTTCKQIQSFLGLTGYFRKFISSYALIAKPLSDLLKKDQIFKFEENEEKAFAKLKCLLTSEPVLSLYKQGSETELHTDASKYGYGACLMQKSDDDNKFHPVYFMSKKTTPAEEKYNSYELEVLAVIQAVKKFRIYLLGYKFRIVTDCSAFQRTMDKKDLTTRVARWALLLEEYSYEIVHRKGSQMSHVDALSRNPTTMMPVTEIITHEDGIIKRIQKAQNADEHIQSIKKILESEESYENYFSKNDILYKYENGRESLVVPQSMQLEIIKKAHDIGHFAIAKTEEVVKREFYMPKLKEKIQNCIQNCVPCILGNKKSGKKEGFLHPISKMEGPLHTYHIDHLGPLPSTNKNYKHILVVIDDFTKFTWLYTTKSTTAKEVVECLTRQQKIFGNPSRIISDRGTAFTAEEFENYCVEEGIKHIRITTGVPRSNGQVERINRIIIPILTKLSLEDPSKWYKFIDRVQRALNCTIQRSINATPFEVLIGTKMKNKEDVLIQELINQEIVTEFCENRECIRQESKQQILKVQEENKHRYNLRRKKAKNYKEGDLVAIKRTQFGPGLKVSQKYLGPYEVVKAKGNERYDVVKVGHHDGPMRTSTCSEYLKPWIDYTSESESDSESGMAECRKF